MPYRIRKKKYRVRPALERFWEKVDIRSPDECWPWKAYRSTSTGYGMFALGNLSEHRGKQLNAHRAGYQLVHGVELPPEVHVCHTCDNRPCCNPSHWFLGSHQQNMEDMSRKRRRHGVRNCRHKLTRMEAALIRFLYTPKKKQGKGTVGALRRRFKVTAPTIYAVLYGQHWTVRDYAV